MFLIRSMSTTDARPGQPIVQYHLYLLKPEKRAGAYWRQDKLDAIRFESVEDALKHGSLCLKDDRFDVVPFDDSQVPTYWDVRKPDYRSRMLGTEVEVDLSRPAPLAMTA